MVHKVISEGYRNNSEVYENIRPEYPPQLAAYFQKYVPKGKVVEIGAGTGKFTRHLLSTGYNLTAVEPIETMRNILESKFPNLNVMATTAENTTLESMSIDAVVVAQAFHWFDYAVALREINRILKSDGFLVCVWNVRDESVKWVNQCEVALAKYAGDTPRHRTLEWRYAIDNSPFFQLVSEWFTENPQLTSKEGVELRALSTSFIARLEKDLQVKVLKEIREIVSTHEDYFYFPYRSEIQIWKKIPD